MTLNSTDVEVPASSVSVYDAIYRRRNVKEFARDPVLRETLERLFSAAVWAPNHRLTNPTRFFVVQHDSPMRTRIAEAAWQSTYDGVVNPNPEQKRRSADAARDRVLNGPAMMYVYSLDGANEEVTRENYATSCCAIQNLALAAVAEGLRIDWSYRRASPGFPVIARYPRRGRCLDDGGRRVRRQGRGAAEHRAKAVYGSGHLAGVISNRALLCLQLAPELRQRLA